MRTEQANVEYFFRLLYELLFGNHSADALAQLRELFAQVWFWVTIIGYGITIPFFILIVYMTMQMFELRKREEEFYNTLLVAPETAAGVNPRWAHIQSLMEQTAPSAWREAITEADIMLEDVLTENGYVGEGVGEKLKAAKFDTIRNAWDAHMVRNQVAHQGSVFDLTEALARRTIQHYESVFRELKAI